MTMTIDSFVATSGCLQTGVRESPVLLIPSQSLVGRREVGRHIHPDYLARLETVSSDGCSQMVCYREDAS